MGFRHGRCGVSGSRCGDMLVLGHALNGGDVGTPNPHVLGGRSPKPKTRLHPRKPSKPPEKGPNFIYDPGLRLRTQAEEDQTSLEFAGLGCSAFCRRAQTQLAR